VKAKTLLIQKIHGTGNPHKKPLKAVAIITKSEREKVPGMGFEPTLSIRLRHRCL
jgi:hypothetical protein